MSKGRRPLAHANRLIAEFNMGAYEYALSRYALTRRVSVAIATHVKLSD